jgi:cytoskeletal protein CcmA (bactofilin family)
MASSENVRVDGAGYVGGSSFGDVTINGSGKIASGVKAGNVVINGSGSAEGELTAESIVVNGSAKLQGPIHVGDLTANGAASIGSGLDVGRLHVKGTVDVGGDISAVDIGLQGVLSCDGDCQAETLAGAGAFEIVGLLNAGRIDLRLFGQCRARDIGGERISVKAGKKVVWFRPFADMRLTADSIEADDVILEYTTAKVVRGHNVRLGTGCQVDLVEYTGTLVKADDVTLGEAKKQPAAAPTAPRKG